MRALIIETGYIPGALAAARALGQSGWRVGSGSPSRMSFASVSRYSSAWHRIDSPVCGIDKFVRDINLAVSKQNYDIVFGAGDAEVLALSFANDRIQTHVPYTNYKHVSNALSKRNIFYLAKKVGLDAPVTYEVKPCVLDRMKGPFVLKPEFHWLPQKKYNSTRIETEIVFDKSELLQKADKIRSYCGLPLVQEYIDGQLIGFTAVTNKQFEVVAQMQQVFLATWRPEAGTAVRAETVTVDEQLSELIQKMLTELRWSGLVQLDLIVTKEGVTKLIDFNGRIYSSLALATAAGVNFMDIWGRLALDKEADANTDAKPGVRFQWMEGDLKRAYLQRHNGLLSDVIGCLRYAPGAAGMIWNKEDLTPLFIYPHYILKRIMKRI